jgi:hypothetical protein
MAAVENHLIELLPRADRRRLLAVCETVELVLSQVLSESGTRTRHVFFPIGATISLVTPIDGKPALEVGMVGREGMVGANSSWGWRRRRFMSSCKDTERPGASPPRHLVSSWRAAPRCSGA